MYIGAGIYNNVHMELRGQFARVRFPSDMYVLGIKLRLSGLVVSAFSC